MFALLLQNFLLLTTTVLFAQHSILFDQHIIICTAFLFGELEHSIIYTTQHFYLTSTALFAQDFYFAAQHYLNSIALFQLRPIFNIREVG